MGEAMLKLIMVFAELERRLTAERTTAIMQDRVERGLWNGGVVYGYLPESGESGRLLVDPEWAPIIKTHFFKVVDAALGDFEAEANKMDSEIEVIRHRLTTVQTEIQNLVAVLKQMGAGAIESVKDELTTLEAEKRQLRDRLDARAEQAAPKTTEAAGAAKRFIDTWSSVGELLKQATPEEQQTILRHYIEVVEISFDDPDGKMGKYAMRLFPEVRPLDTLPHRNGNGTPKGGSVLTEDRIVCQLDQKAPVDQHV